MKTMKLSLIKLKKPCLLKIKWLILMVRALIRIKNSDYRTLIKSARLIVMVSARPSTITFNSKLSFGVERVQPIMINSN
jgi:hypothetical protein